METEKKIVIAGREITVRKQNFKKQLAVLNAFKDIPELEGFISQIDTTNNTAVLSKISEIVILFIDRLVPYIVDLLDKQIDADFITEKCGLDDLTEVIYTIVEVNKVAKVVDYIKKTTALVKPQQKNK